MTVPVMVNRCYGGFGLSEAAMDEYRRRRPLAEDVVYYDIERDDPLMVQIVRELGARANGPHAQIELERIPAVYARHYSIHEYDGLEHVVLHRNAYRVDTARAILRDRHLTPKEKLWRVAAVLGHEHDARA